jgi:hypothetical protein
VHRLALSLLIAILWLTGCRALPSPPMTDKLQRVAAARSFVLDEPLYWRLDYRPADLGVVPGVYRATQENAIGTFFEGPLGAYFLLSHDEKEGEFIERTDGGLWIPKDGGPARVWGWFDERHVRTKQSLDRRATPNEIFSALTGAAGGTQPGRLSDAGQEIAVRQVSLGQMPGGVAGGARAGAAGAIGGVVADGLLSAYIGMRGVVIFTLPADEKVHREFEALTRRVAGAPSKP